MKFFYFKEKPTALLRHGGKLQRNTCFSEKTYENERKWRKHIQDAKRLAEELQKYPCL